MMLLSGLIVSIFISYVVNANDFDDNTLGYEFIYHDETNLLLIKHGDSCYYTDLPEMVEPLLADYTWFFVNTRFSSESLMISNIMMGISTVPTTLEAMRNKYKDLLADFHCIDKKIYEFVWHPDMGNA